MKTRRFLAATGFLLATFASGTPHAQSTNFILENDTQFTVYAVYIWPSGTTYPGPDLLGDDTIDSGKSYTFEPTNGDCTYNVRVVLGDLQAKRWNRVNLCELSTLSLHYNFMEQAFYASRH